MPSVIAVLPESSEVNLIRESLGRDGLELRAVRSPEDALKLLDESADDSVILYDADRGQPWRDALPRFLTARPGSRVVLLAESANHQTWLDLFDGGGFDLIMRPVRPSDLRAIVRCAIDPPRYFCAAA